jgi:hypothetical protein
MTVTLVGRRGSGPEPRFNRYASESKQRCRTAADRIRNHGALKSRRPGQRHIDVARQQGRKIPREHGEVRGGIA